MGQIVKYHNDLNNISLGGLSENQINILFTIFASIKDRGTQELDFEFDKIIKLSGISQTNKEYLELTVFKSLDKLQNLKIRYIDKDKSKVQEVVFPRVKIDESRTTLSIKVSEAFAYIFNELIGNFTKFELAEFVNLSGKYAKTLYRLLKQYRKTGLLKMDWDRFVEIMDIPTTYAIRDIEKIIIKPAIKQLSAEQNLFDQRRTPFKDLSYKKTKTKGQGNKITGIEFTFAPQKQDDDKSELQENLQKLQELNKAISKPSISPITGKEVTELNAYIGKHFYIKNKLSGSYDTCKISHLQQSSDKRIILTAANQETGKNFIMDFDSLEHIKNALGL